MKRALPFLLLLSLLSGCAPEPVSQSFFAMDTVMSVTLYDGGDTAALVAAQQEVNRLDQLWSRTRPESDVSRLNAAAGSGTPVEVDPDTAALLEQADRAARESGMAFDPVMAPVMDAWGFGATGSESTAVHRVPSQAELDALLPLTRDLPRVEGTAVSLPLAGQAVDLGGIAKGAAAGHVLEVLTGHGVGSAIIDLGGNITALGEKPDGSPFRVMVKDPRDSEGGICVLSLADGATCSTSGGYERYFEADGQVYHHIIDPSTGYPARSGLLSVTVVSQDPYWADAWSTALFVLGAEEALDLWREGPETVQAMELILVEESGRVLVTEGLEEGLEFLGEEAGYTCEIVRR